MNIRVAAILILLAVPPLFAMPDEEPASQAATQSAIKAETQPASQPESQPATQADTPASQPDFEQTSHLPAATQSQPADSQPDGGFAPQSQPTTVPATLPAKSSPRQAGLEEKKITVSQAAVLGLVEGLTEYLPVSSTGHLIIAGHLMGHSEFSDQAGPLGKKIVSSRAIDAFDIVIQLGAILAVLGLYRRRVGQMCLGLVGRDPWGLKLLGMLLLAFMPAMIFGYLLRKPIKENLFSPTTVCWALFVGGLLMIVVERFYRARKGKTARKNLNQMTAWQALFIGLMQCLAMWPGTSRSMVTILAGMIVGLEIVAAAEFSFLLALPTLGAATIYEGIREWSDLMNSAGPAGLAVGLVVSGIVAAASVKFLVRWLTRHGLTPFGIYRIIAAGALWWLLVR